MNLSRAIVDEEDDNDDWKMINARRAASEIEWYDTMGDSTASSAPTTTKQVKKRGTWSTDEQDRYCEGVKLFRFGSWKRIADHVGTRTVSQVMSHAQSVRAKKKRVIKLGSSQEVVQVVTDQ
ncbi:Hypothetical protein PHPALM_37271 [Phytophthora palmivora]|uniref:Uncharacterized protein n=1 Tax=Phytophthora palmivora TaxID=4796 RepID=A0A2P4WXU6_9STRA|nr:Hypothetical protein PHPALM_37271 [Phytophthora palmivora]